MINELKKVGETFNTEYSLYGTDIIIVVPVLGYKDHVEAALERCRETAPKSPINFNTR